MKGILFSPDMAAAIRERYKTMTRRIMVVRTSEMRALMINLEAGVNRKEVIKELIRIYAPYELGDILYVREEHYVYGDWGPVEGVFTPTGKQKMAFVPKTMGSYAFDAEGRGNRPLMPKGSLGLGWYKRQARFMFKKWARTFIQVTDIRVERLQNITDEDALAEGVMEMEDGTYYNYSRTPGFRYEDGVECLLPRASFMTLFDRVHTAGTWEVNPWVWVISFKLISKPL